MVEQFWYLGQPNWLSCRKWPRGKSKALCSGFALSGSPTLGELQRLLLQLVGDLGKDPKAMEISFPLRLNSARCHGLAHFCLIYVREPEVQSL